jgi:hypothetical protein
MPDAGRATCGQKCDLSYSADIDDCRFQYGNDPADADALADCIQEAKDDYQNCLGDCANRAISPPSRALRENSAFSVKYERFRSSRSVFVQASTSARKPILVESRTMRSAASGGVSKARTSKIAPT